MSRDPRAAQRPRSVRRRRRRPLLSRRAILAILAAAVVLVAAFAGFRVYQQRQHEARARAFAVAQTEALALAPLNGAPPPTTTREIDNGAAPFLSLQYRATTSCDTVQNHYAAEAVGHGWKPTASGTPTASQVSVSYTKASGGYALTLAVDCASLGDSYQVLVRAG